MGASRYITFVPGRMIEGKSGRLGEIVYGSDVPSLRIIVWTLKINLEERHRGRTHRLSQKREILIDNVLLQIVEASSDLTHMIR